MPSKKNLSRGSLCDWCAADADADVDISKTILWRVNITSAGQPRSQLSCKSRFEKTSKLKTKDNSFLRESDTSQLVDLSNINPDKPIFTLIYSSYNFSNITNHNSDYLKILGLLMINKKVRFLFTLIVNVNSRVIYHQYAPTEHVDYENNKFNSTIMVYLGRKYICHYM